MSPHLVKWQEVDAVKQDKADINDGISVPRGYEDGSLLELVTLGRVFVRQDERRKSRYLAVWEKDPNLVCEITKGAFEAIVKTDIVDKQKEILKKRKEHIHDVIRIDERTGKPVTTQLKKAGKLLWERKRRKDIAKLSEL